jgi:hypothetical protein
VKMRARPERIDKELINSARWKRCALSQEPFKAPVVADLMVCRPVTRHITTPHASARCALRDRPADRERLWLTRRALCALCFVQGNLFNKEAVIKYLLDKLPIEKFAHIKTLKVRDSRAASPALYRLTRLTLSPAAVRRVQDVWTVRLTYEDTKEAAATNGGGGGGGGGGVAKAKSGAVDQYFICPITNTIANGRYPYVCPMPCARPCDCDSDLMGCCDVCV